MQLPQKEKKVYTTGIRSFKIVVIHKGNKMKAEDREKCGFIKLKSL